MCLAMIALLCIRKRAREARGTSVLTQRHASTPRDAVAAGAQYAPPQRLLSPQHPTSPPASAFTSSGQCPVLCGPCRSSCTLPLPPASASRQPVPPSSLPASVQAPRPTRRRCHVAWHTAGPRSSHRLTRTCPPDPAVPQHSAPRTFLHSSSGLESRRAVQDGLPSAAFEANRPSDYAHPMAQSAAAQAASLCGPACRRHASFARTCPAAAPASPCAAPLPSCPHIASAGFYSMDDIRSQVVAARTHPAAAPARPCAARWCPPARTAWCAARGRRGRARPRTPRRRSRRQGRPPGTSTSWGRHRLPKHSITMWHSAGQNIYSRARGEGAPRWGAPSELRRVVPYTLFCVQETTAAACKLFG